MLPWGEVVVLDRPGHLLIRVPIGDPTRDGVAPIGVLEAFHDASSLEGGLAGLVWQEVALFSVTLPLSVLAVWVVLWRQVARPLRQVVRAMTGVAEGENLDAALPDVSVVELRRMNHALTVFRENMLERIAFARRSASAEAEAARLQRERAADEERRRREDAEAQAAEREAAERMRARERALVADLARVIEGAAGGDYDLRVTLPDGADAAAVKIAELVNVLVERTAEGIEGITSTLLRLAEGQVSARMEGTYLGAFELLQTRVNAAAERLDMALAEVSRHATDVLGDSSDLSAAATELSARTERTAGALAETAESLDDIVRSVAETARLADAARVSASEAEGEMSANEQVVRDAIDAMEQISTLSERISQTLAVIDDIAFQTNLLALNAGVEAARAGPAGRGFAVVASEVRALAGKVAGAAQEIGDLVRSSSERIEDGVDRVGRTGDTLSALGRRVREIGAQVSEIAEGAADQSASAEEMSAKMSQIDRATQENAAMFEETTAANLSLKSAASRMLGLVDAFETSESDRDRAFRKAGLEEAERIVGPPAGSRLSART